MDNSPNKNPLGVDLVQILALDKRVGLWLSLELGLTNIYGYKVRPFVAGSGTNKELTYSIVDNEDPTPLYRDSSSYPSWLKRNNAYKAWKTHKAMMEYAISENCESCLFLEDDAVLMDSYKDKLPLVEEFAAGHDWDMFYLGVFVKPNDVLNVSPEVISLTGYPAGGFHAVAMKKHIMEKLVKFPPLMPFDEICWKYLHNSFKCYAVYPPIIVQQGGWSFVEDHFLGRRPEDNYC